MYLFLFCCLIQSHFHTLISCMFEAFSSAGSELCTARRWTFCWDPAVTSKLLHHPVLVFFLYSKLSSPHKHTYRLLYTCHISKETASWTLEKKVLLQMSGQQRRQASWLSCKWCPKTKGSPDNTSINEDRHRLKMYDLAGGPSWDHENPVKTDSVISWELICCSLFAICVCCFMCVTVTLLWGCF